IELGQSVAQKYFMELELDKLNAENNRRNQGNQATGSG
ncbi:unnamed protein product, partial [Rotaria magnacalcarata]